MNYFLILAVIISFIFTIYKGQHDLHVIQQNGYTNSKYVKWLNNQDIIKKSDLMFALGLLFMVIPSLLPDLVVLKIILFVIGVPFIVLSVLMFYVKTHYKPTKKGLVYTTRVKRLLGCFVLLVSILAAIAVSFNSVFLTLLICIYITSFSSTFVLTANYINRPIEKAVRDHYINDAKKILAENENLLIIGITGSYGKTSVKNILTTLLSRKYSVLMTPESYNTPMGVVKTIRGELKSTHDIFICEMGAYCLGEIKEICDIAQPDMGIITSIGPQHLETFKTIENVITTKGELFQNVTKGGKIFINLDDENILKIQENPDAEKITFSKGKKQKKASDYRVEDIVISGEGTSFNVICKSTKEVYPIKTKLLGAHNIDNMLGSISIAIELGLSSSDINRALIDIEPVKHRLSYNKTAGGYTILDDAFNSNPVGSKYALEVLKEFPGNKKIIITPGMIDLGVQQEELNMKFGEYMKSTCDFVILVGKNQTAPIQLGLENKKYPEDKIYIAKDLNDALEKMNSIVEKDDVVLLENDLPDIFNE